MGRGGSVAIVLLAFVLAACAQETELAGSRDSELRAGVEVSPVRGEVPLQVEIDSREAVQGDGDVLRELFVNGEPFGHMDALHTLEIAEPGEHELRVRLSNDLGDVVEVSRQVTAWSPGAAPEPAVFNIELVTEGSFSASQREAFRSASERWTRVLTAGLPDVTVTSAQTSQACDLHYSGTIDDLLLHVKVEEIDGPGGVVAMAGPCLLRSNGMPLVGLIIIDSSDLQSLTEQRYLETVVAHELGHVLGLNYSSWKGAGLVDHDHADCYASSSVGFSGGLAQHEYHALGGAHELVPVEANGVPGTACSHWAKGHFHNELMTGYLERDAPLSRVTVGALADMGYEVDMTGADQHFTLHPAGRISPLSSGEELHELLIAPRGMIDEDGELQRLPDGYAVMKSLDLR